MGDENGAKHSDELANWTRREFKGIPASLNALWTRREGDSFRYAVTLDKSHENAQGYIHGGVLTTFADHAMSLIIWEASGRANCTTVQLSSHFLSAIKAPAFVEIETIITKRGRQMIFARSILHVQGEPVMEVTGVWRVFQTDTKVDDKSKAKAW
jgi:acyl-coenzyme A thioesterase PaaI-like protein